MSRRHEESKMGTHRLAEAGRVATYSFLRISRFVVSFACWLCVVAPLHAQALTVEAGGLTLAEAVAQATPGTQIHIAAGTHTVQNLVLDVPGLVLDGAPGAVLDGGGEAILILTADSITVRGLVLQNVATSYVDDRAAIKVDEANHCRLEGNMLRDTFFGIYLAKAGHCQIVGNDLQGGKTSESRSGNGIHLWYSRWATIDGNTIRGHRDGIYLEFVEDSEVTNNVSTDNMRYGLHFMFSDRCAYRHNTLRQNGAGVAVMYTEDVEMIGNTFADNWGSASFGLLLKDITDSRIEGNTFVRNTIGIYAEGSNRMTVTGKTFDENGWAVKILANAEDNLFARNNFTRNTFDVATNSRSHYSTFAGNYWDKYEGYDLDRDGVGDVPFRPVRLFSLMVERNEPALILLRSVFVDLLDAAERVLPTLTPETLIDEQPAMRRLP